MERGIVWVLIIALVLFAAIEARARFGYSQTLPAVEEAVLGNHPRLDELGESIHFWPSRIREERAGRSVVVLKWFSFLHDYRIALSVDSNESDNPIVMHVSTAGEPDSILAEPLGPAAADDQELTAADMPMTGESGPPPGDDAGGADGDPGLAAPEGAESRAPRDGAPRQPRNFEDLDQDGDGKLTGDELSDRMKERLAENDTNQDGALDQQEFDAMRARFRSRRQEGGAPGAAAPDGAERERPAEAPDADPAPADETAPADDKPEASL